MAGENISSGWGYRRDTKVLFWFTQRSDHIQLSGLPFASAFLGLAATDDNEAAILPSLFVLLLAALWVFRYALVDDRVSNFEVVRVVDPLLHTTGLGADLVRRGSWLDSGCVAQRCGGRRLLASEFQRASASDATIREKRRCGRRQGLGRCSDISMESSRRAFSGRDFFFGQAPPISRVAILGILPMSAELRTAVALARLKNHDV